MKTCLWKKKSSWCNTISSGHLHLLPEVGNAECVVIVDVGFIFHQTPRGGIYSWPLHTGSAGRAGELRCHHLLVVEFFLELI